MSRKTYLARAATIVPPRASLLFAKPRPLAEDESARPAEAPSIRPTFARAPTRGRAAATRPDDEAQVLPLPGPSDPKIATTFDAAKPPAPALAASTGDDPLSVSHPADEPFTRNGRTSTSDARLAAPRAEVHIGTVEVRVQAAAAPAAGPATPGVVGAQRGRTVSHADRASISRSYAWQSGPSRV